MLIATWKRSGMIVAALLKAGANPNFMLKVWCYAVQFSPEIIPVNSMEANPSKQCRAASVGYL